MEVSRGQGAAGLLLLSVKALSPLEVCSTIYELESKFYLFHTVVTLLN